MIQELTRSFLMAISEGKNKKLAMPDPLYYDATPMTYKIDDINEIISSICTNVPFFNRSCKI